MKIAYSLCRLSIYSMRIVIIELNIPNNRILAGDPQKAPNIGKIIKPFLDNPDLLTNTSPELLEYRRNEWDRIGSNISEIPKI